MFKFVGTAWHEFKANRLLREQSRPEQEVVFSEKAEAVTRGKQLPGETLT